MRSLVTMVPIMLAFLVLAKTNFLFPKPVYNPAQKPQKPKAIPLSEAEDRVLFEVEGNITGPWRIGALDVYDGKAWRLPPFDPKRLRVSAAVSSTRIAPARDGEDHRARPGQHATLPTVATPAKITLSGASVVFDPRSDTVRVKSGRVPGEPHLHDDVAQYPTGVQLQAPRRPTSRR